MLRLRLKLRLGFTVLSQRHNISHFILGVNRYIAMAEERLQWCDCS